MPAIKVHKRIPVSLLHNMHPQCLTRPLTHPFSHLALYTTSKSRRHSRSPLFQAFLQRHHQQQRGTRFPLSCLYPPPTHTHPALPTPPRPPPTFQAFFRGTISNNTAEATTPDDGRASTVSGAINLNPFLDGTSLANSLALSGKNATSDAKGLVFGIIGTGKVSSGATALGKTVAQSNVEGMSLNALGAQNTVSSNLGLTLGPATTSVKSGAMTFAGPVTTAGISNALGVKSASADGKAASATGLGPSSSSMFTNAITQGTASASSGVLATSLVGPTSSSVGSLATSLKGDASTDSKAKSLSGEKEAALGSWIRHGLGGSLLFPRGQALLGWRRNAVSSCRWGIRLRRV